MKKVVGSLLVGMMGLISVANTCYASTGIEFGNTVAVSTDNGSFDIQIDAVHLVESWNDDASVKNINLLCVIDNHDYQTWIYDGTEKNLCIYPLSTADYGETLLRVEDNEGFVLSQIDVTPYEDGNYKKGDVAINSKARVCIPFECAPDCSGISIVIQDEYVLNVNFDDSGDGQCETLTDADTKSVDVELESDMTYEELVEKIATLSKDVEELKKEVELLEGQ